MVGTTIEWYDFLFMVQQQPSFLTSYFSQIWTHLQVCLQHLQPMLLGLLSTLGGSLYHFGDKIYCKSMLLLTLMLMGIPTVLIGILPTYESIGYWAAIGLVILRFIQGIPWAVSGAVPCLWQ